MYLYFDNNGILKEIVDDVATRKGNNEVNRLYIYVDGITPKTEWITYQTSDGVQSNETLIETTITKTIPYDRNRDLKYFKNFQEYLFYVATIPSSVLTVSGLTKASVRVALQDDSLMTLGLIIFTIEESVVLQDSFITESQYQYLLNIISNFEELNNTGVIGISTQIVNGAVAPYDQGRIVLSTYNDNFTVATVVKNSTNQNVYNVLDMTFVKQVPFNSSNPNLEGLEINGKKYKVAYKTSQLNNDAGFITNSVSNLINYYDKTTVDEKLANIDLSEYYTKTESDGRYVLTTNFSWNNLANKPTSLSDFINDEGFITNTVSNLSNYYDKTTIDNIVATLKTGAFQVVSELPSTGVEGVVYLVGTEAPYTMYIWENNAFLNIGTTEVNLDGYVKGTNLNSNYVILGNGGSNVVASSYTINNQNANDPNSLLTAKVINTLLGTKQDVLTGGQGINISDNTISTPVSTTSTTISQQSVNKLKYDGKPILVDYAIKDDSGRNIVDTYATFNDLHTLDIGDITSPSNIYQTLYQKVYENDTTKKNVVIFSTEGFVDSATSLISAGDHIATPYQDNKILIDSVFVLNSDNSATTIISSDTVVIDLGRLEGQTGTLSPDIVSEINNAISGNKHFVLKVNAGFEVIFPNLLYVEGNGLYAVSFSLSGELSSFFISIDLSSGQYIFSKFELQEKLVSGTNIKTVNEQSLVGSGNIAVQEPLVSGTNIKTVNGQSILGNGNIPVQEPLVSGTNIKTINGQTILGNGNIEISGGSASKMVNLGTLSSSGTLATDKLQELMTLFQNGDLIQATFVFNNSQFITANAYSNGSSMDIVAYNVSNSLNVVNLSINPENGNYTITTIEISGGGGSASKMVNLGTLSSSGTLATDKLQELMTLFQNGDLIQATFVFNNSQFITANAYSNGSSMDIVVYAVIPDFGSVAVADLSINTANGNYTLTPIEIPSSFKTINGSKITGSGNINTGLPAKQYTISNLNFTNFSEGQSVNISGRDSTIIENARTNQASVIYNEVNLQYLPLLYVEAANDVQVLYSDLHGHCGVVRINTTNKTATVLSVFKTGKNSTINLDTISSTKTNYDNVFNYLVDQGFARAYFNVEGFLDQTNSIGNEQYYEAYLSGDNNYFASCGKIYQYIVDTSTQGFHVELINGIKTVNEQSLVGSGNIAVQEPLVSGTNIKTVNNQSLLGAGNIEISGGLTLPSTSPSSQLIPSITTSNEQQNLTIGDGLVVDNGALKTIGTKYYEITITRNLFDYNGKTTDEKANYVSYATDYTLKFIIDETNYNALLNSISSQLGFTVDTEYLINNYNTLKQMPEYISGLIGGLKICAVGSISSITNSTSLAYINNCCYIAIPSIEGEDSWFKCTPGYFGTLCAYDADKKQMTKIGWDSVAENSTLTITTKYL